jgi:hypothetical protein
VEGTAVSLLALAKNALLRSCERSELSEKSELRSGAAGDSSHNSLSSLHSQLRSSSEHVEVAPPPALLDELRAHKAELGAALRAAEPPWDDDREWIYRWRTAGPTLADREHVVRAWLAAAPPEPLPRGLPAVELARIARNHGIVVEVAPPAGSAVYGTSRRNGLAAPGAAGRHEGVIFNDDINNSTS